MRSLSGQVGLLSRPKLQDDDTQDCRVLVYDLAFQASSLSEDD